jgi:methylaspartate ammonia-lyase
MSMLHIYAASMLHVRGDPASVQYSGCSGACTISETMVHNNSTSSSAATNAVNLFAAALERGYHTCTGILDEIIPHLQAQLHINTGTSRLRENRKIFYIYQ